ncbi:hypothetical protein TrST_g10821 [Triparma strigata]|uniref:PDZ domain-containing protein n=1 Tax=Triparma strigata TaxID=1606541 RepID=A0A9W7AZ03_9STRA|nr:hypothetical protein TrST_g10821 [Triparma strigata]
MLICIKNLPCALLFLLLLPSSSFFLPPLIKLATTLNSTPPPKIELLTFTLRPPIESLGCTVEETLCTDEKGMVFVSCFPPSDCSSLAREAGLKVGDVLTGVSSMFGDDISKCDSGGLKKVKELVQARLGTGEELRLEVLRGTGVIQRHNAALDERIREKIMEEDREKEMDLFGTLYGGGEEEVVATGGGEECVVDYDAEGLIDTLWINCAEEDGEEATAAGMKKDSRGNAEMEESKLEGDEEEQEEIDPAEEYELWRTGQMVKQQKAKDAYKANEFKPNKKYNPSDYTNKSGSGTFIRNPSTGELERF